MATTYTYDDKDKDDSKNKSEDYYRRFYDTNRSPFTRDTYKQGLKPFMKFLGIPEGEYCQLIDNKSILQIEDLVAKFITSERKRNASYRTQKNYLDGIMHFYAMNHIKLDRTILSKYLSNDDTNPDDEQDPHDRPYADTELDKMLKLAPDLRTQAEIELMASAGLRLGALPFLKMRDLIYVKKYKLHQIRQYFNSKSRPRYTFCSPECSEILDRNIQFRKDVGEVIVSTSPVLRRDFDSTDKIRAANNHDKITREAIKRDIQNVLYK